MQLQLWYATPPTEFLSFASEKCVDDFANINKTLAQQVLIFTVYQITHPFITPSQLKYKPGPNCFHIIYSLTV